MNSQLPTSYSTSYTLWGLFRRYLALIRGDLTIVPIINDITAIFPVLSTTESTIVTERRTASRSHVGFTMRSLEGAICSGGSICKWPSCRHSLYSTPICAICVGPIFVKISGIVGGHTLSAIRHKRSEFVATLLVKRGQIFEIRPPQKF